MELNDLYKHLSDKDREVSFEYTNRLQNNIIERQKLKIDGLLKEIELLNQDVENLRKSIQINFSREKAGKTTLQQPLK